MSKVLVIGCTGFVGRHLVRHLVARGHHVEGWSRHEDCGNGGELHRQVDLLACGALPQPGGSPWDIAFHLAGHTQPGRPWNRQLVMENLRMTARVFDHLAQTTPGCRVILASSAHVYASSDDKLTEDSPVGPRHLYGLSKRLCEVWALARTEVLQVQIVRPFTQVGTGMPAGLMIPDLMERIRSGQTPVRMRGRDDRRDYLDIRDAVEAYEALMTVNAPSGSIWNLCSGKEHRVSELVRAVLDRLEISVPLQFEQPGTEALLGDRRRLTDATGWVPRFGLVQTGAHLADGYR